MSSEDLSLEKLKIVERLTSVEITMGKMVEHLQIMIKLKDESHASIQKILDRHDHDINGNGNIGLKTAVDRLVTTENNRRWHLRLIYGALVGLFLKNLFEFISKYFHEMP